MKTSKTLPVLHNRILGLAAVLLMVLAICCPAVTGQSFYGGIVGAVTDTSGAAVPGAVVKITNTGTNETRSVKSDTTGSFTFVNLLPADYKLEVEAPSFKHFVRVPVQVKVGSAARIDAALEVGAATETVEVTTQSPLLQTESGQMGQQVEGTTVQEMPLNGRNTMNLISLTAGVIPQGATSGSTTTNQTGGNTNAAGWNNYQIGGGIAGQSAAYVDGTAVNVLGNTSAYVPTQDVVQEFSVASNAVSADFGRFSGGVVNMTTKSGSNAFHGSAYEYVRNTVLNGNNWFTKRDQLKAGLANKPPKWNQNQYGISAGGPILKDKVFFFFSWENHNIRMGNAQSTNVPTTGMKAGRIPFRYNGSTLINVTDPLGKCTPVQNTTGGYWDISGCTLDTTALQLMNYYPDTNTGTSTVFNSVVNTGNDSKQYNARVDYNLSANQRVFGRYAYWNLGDISYIPFPTAKYVVGNGATKNITHLATLGDTYTINPTTILDVRLSYLREMYNTNQPNTNVDESKFFPGKSFITQENIKIYPAFTLANQRGLYQAWNGGGQNWKFFSNYQVSSNLVKIAGRHTFKAGTELRLMRYDYSGSGNGGSFSVGNNYTGDEWADLLLGYASSGTGSVGASTTTYNYYQAYYLQDTWQFSQKLTLNLGLRYDFPGGLAEKNDKATVLLPNAVDPYTGVKGTLALVSSALYGSRSVMQTPRRSLSPRLGFAYRINSNTAIRGGFGVVFLPPDQAITKNGGPANAPINAAQTAFNNGNTLSSSYTPLSNPFPNGLTLPSGRSNPAFMTARLFTATINGNIPTDPYPYMQQWNLSISRQMKGDWVIDAGYAGSKGTHLPALVGGDDELSSSWWSKGDNNTKDCVLTTPIGAYTTTTTRGRCRQPYPYYNAVNDMNASWASSNYHSLQAKVEKRFKSGGIVMASYTWSKSLGDTDTMTGYLEAKANASTRTSGIGNLQDYNNHRSDHSILSFNLPQRLVVSYVIPLPFGKGQKYLSNLNAVGSRIVSGWALNGISTFQSGFSVGIQEATGNNLTNTFGAGQLRPDLKAGCSKSVSGSSRDRLTQWFNTSCFEAPGTSTGMVGWALGNEARVDGGITAEGTHNWDISVSKATKITERTNIDFRGEFFNIFNRTQFSPPVIQRGNGQFGQILSQGNQPRLVQFSLRMKF